MGGSPNSERAQTTKKCYGLVATSLFRVTSERASELSLSFPAPCSRVSFRVPLARFFSISQAVTVFQNSSYVSGVSVCIFVALYVRMFFAGANKVECTMSWMLRNQ